MKGQGKAVLKLLGYEKDIVLVSTFRRINGYCINLYIKRIFIQNTYGMICVSMRTYNIKCWARERQCVNDSDIPNEMGLNEDGPAR